MPRLAKSTTIWSDDDDFPDIDALVTGKKPRALKDVPKSRQKPSRPSTVEETTKPASSVRRRKLGPLTDNLLLRAWTPDSAEDDGEGRDSGRERESMEPRRTRVELRTRKSRPTAPLASSPLHDEEYVSAQEEVTIIEDMSMFDGTFHSCNSEGSGSLENSEGSEGSEYSGSEDIEEEDGDFQANPAPTSLRIKPMVGIAEKKRPGRTNKEATNDYCSTPEEEENRNLPKSDGRPSTRRHDAESKPARAQKGERKPQKAAKDLTDSMSKLRLAEIEEESQKLDTSYPSDREVTPPSTPPKFRPGLTSPKKLPRIPTTPHRPNSDMFWSQEFVDDWNDEHSPRKQLFPDALTARQNSPTKNSPEKKPKKSAGSKEPSEREIKKAFENTKHELAENFLQELDRTITDGKLSQLAASTGGIKLIWTNKLNTTAGRANWKRETIRNRQQQPDGTTTTTITTHKHHASIELAEKVIDSESRLINVLAHEFCHLANFMISGITTNPHGREFKIWAAQTSRAFASRGVCVTTKHSYDIDFKYVWACVECATEFKRHSKSIDPARHRCGVCKSELRQTKPVPRGRKAEGDGGGNGVVGGGGEGKKPKVVSGYQAFMKEQMRVVKEENPGSPQKEIMRIVASRWTAKKAEAAAATPTPDERVKEVEGAVEELAV